LGLVFFVFLFFLIFAFCFIFASCFLNSLILLLFYLNADIRAHEPAKGASYAVLGPGGLGWMKALLVQHSG
jgi:hypothetical protein